MGTEEVNWFKDVDWTRSNDALAFRYQVSARTVANKRRAFFHMLRTCWGDLKRYGVSSAYVSRMRKKYGIRYERKIVRRRRTRRPTRPDGRPASEGIRAFVLEAIDAGHRQTKDIHDYVLDTWGTVSRRTIFTALSHLLSLKVIVYTQEHHLRLYKRGKEG